jgi:RNA-directed DNA polymerase
LLLYLVSKVQAWTSGGDSIVHQSPLVKLSDEKTTITHIDEGFDFLGWNARKYRGKFLIKPSRKSVVAFLRELRKLVKEGKALKQSRLIEKLNPLIRG